MVAAAIIAIFYVRKLRQAQRNQVICSGSQTSGAIGEPRKSVLLTIILSCPFHLNVQDKILNFLM